MSNESYHIEFQSIDEIQSLPEDEQLLLRRAMEATEGAYAPYSDFHVGCALQLEDGEIIIGNNQENLAYPSALCAERVALYHAGSHGKAKQIRKIAVRCASPKLDVNVPVTPCGACRQVMLEYERMAQHPFIVLMQGERGKILKIKGVEKSLLPFGFDIDL